MLSAAAELPMGRDTRADTRTPTRTLEFESVYTEHFDFVWRSVRRLGATDASVDDIVQETFLVVYRRLSSFEGRASVRSWLFGIARRVLSDHRRKKRRRPEQSLPDEPGDHEGPTPHESAARQQAAELLHRFLESLPVDQREVFVLAELEQMTAPEIAEATDTKLNTVYSRLRLSRASFEKMVARHHAHDHDQGGGR